MPITLNAEKSRFESETDGEIAVAEFVSSPGVLTITHVIVPTELRGGGIASGLAAHVAEHARREGLKVKPQCPFMAAWMKKHPETRDLIA